ncbi:efflux RND transporter periplasmic adaptor subunit [Rhodopseudomonas palustris]|uniref:Secretion protein HlyD n=1 Tax=Rhodopseudomonas palustris (strain BisB18) TaxID=316056 RepID=Q21AY0_RHOPB
MPTNPRPARTPTDGGPAQASAPLKPILATLLAALLSAAGGEQAAAQAEQPASAQVIVARATNACFSDMVRVTGFFVPRREAVAGVDQEGARIAEILVREGDSVSDNQELIRLTGARSVRAPAAGLVIQIAAAVGAPASPQAGPMLRIAVGGEIELDAEVPGIHALKLSPGAPARISRDDGPDLVGKVRLVAPQLDRATQLGHVRLSLPNNPPLKVGSFARANIDARRSCGVAIPRTAVDRLAVQVVNGNIIETRKVRVGLTSESSIEILEGLKEGEIVVADAGTSLHDGDQVKALFADDLDRTRVR